MKVYKVPQYRDVIETYDTPLGNGHRKHDNFFNTAQEAHKFLITRLREELITVTKTSRIAMTTAKAKLATARANYILFKEMTQGE